MCTYKIICMKKFILILCAVFTFSQFSLAQVTFKFSEGIYNQTLKVQVERNVSALLTEINKAEQGGRGILDLSSVRIDKNACNGLASLWKISTFVVSGNTMCNLASKILLGMKYARFLL